MSPSTPTPAASSPLSLEQQICYAMHTTVRAFDAVYREILAEHALSYPQYIALMTVAEHGPLTVGRLGELMHLDSGTLSPLLKRMESAGLVRRARDPRTSDASSCRSRRPALSDSGPWATCLTRSPPAVACPGRSCSTSTGPCARSPSASTPAPDPALPNRRKPTNRARFVAFRRLGDGGRWGGQLGRTIETAWMSIPMRP